MAIATTEKILDTLARTIYGEARGESLLGKIAVAYTVVNRADSPRWWGKTVLEVCLKPWQYSCWNYNDPNLPLLKKVTLDSHSFRDCFAVACLVLNRSVEDSSFSATHYYSLSMVTPPKWAAKLTFTAIIGNHRFYREEV